MPLLLFNKSVQSVAKEQDGLEIRIVLSKSDYEPPIILNFEIHKKKLKKTTLIYESGLGGGHK